MKEFLKRLIKLSPIPLSKNHKYDIQTKKIISRLGDDFNSIDVGCHKGEIMDLLLESSPKGIHFGIEALPNMFENLTLKYQETSNCTILNFAASNETKEIEFNHVITNPAYSGMLKRDYDRPDEKDVVIKVQSKKLDDQIPSEIKIDLIKIDVEGAELQVLEGSKNLIKKSKPIVIFEHGLGASDHYGTTPEKLFQFFDNQEMRISNLGGYLKNGNYLSLKEFKRQYDEKENYYFIAHS